MTTTESGHDAAHRYVAGTLSEQEVEAFEIHLLECERCREEVRLGTKVRAAFESFPAEAERRRGVMRRLAVPLVLAAATLVFIVIRRDNPLQELGRVEPPPFVGAAVRDATPADSIGAMVDRGMSAYTSGDYRRAALELGAASARDSAAAVAFYLGVSRMMLGDAPEAIRAFAGALHPPGNPYANDARLFAAKGWLRLGRADSALAALQALQAANGPARAQAAALADSVRQAIR